ncbi:hypothetical protein ACJ73_01366 [Blastomyces percursus]|uniref:Uncharacterized protein n=1 Tax=Blastomyces percursus TaxID=1658174 RepID=A0A1J9RHY9_9EURO|nr:hypothetical protein ACJ73_01366 [Blastomyces percursus]
MSWAGKFVKLIQSASFIPQLNIFIETTYAGDENGCQITLRVAGTSDPFSGTAKRSAVERIEQPKQAIANHGRNAIKLNSRGRLRVLTFLNHRASCKGLVQEANIETKKLRNGHVQEDDVPKDLNGWMMTQRPI